MKITAKTNKAYVAKLEKRYRTASAASQSLLNKPDAPPTEIFEIIRERKQKVGIMLGMIQKGVIKVGWCKAALKKGDKFDKDFGLKLAKQRATKKEKTPALPLCMKRDMVEFQARCIRYFKGAKSMDLVPQ